MHFVSGGAFQGKRKWVNAHYSFTHTSYSWYCAYENMFPLPHDETAAVVVLEGIEHWIREYFFPYTDDEKEAIRSYMCAWKQWEQAGERTVVWIGCDIGQGIVPIEAHERAWRDMVGWTYQQLASICNRVDYVWCGINERIK
ncbi:cobalamin biosynthesis protein CobU [Anoxybacillus gonensis]|uniref:Adenosylcobinamide kinase n=1 Tax=Anoxybacillus gonensis TaxID=198467 RepID=A0AAW7TC27_9BACL|nr:bifunctional adenosylcobinamide kinase/adenosylcobinamide-phosphate guanylyltransferase [Anoxybacillus gonensis]AKS38728.1 cobalamin biosynthesis protein CobU [Anoxybacillus gonensis]KGP60161.1 cobalamin biosynthesis protein CobU [Anoxybacillus gonensis]MCX8046017.1 bifunctional adenosylcobinamide kinase/adenosylcobinamide-phosphate guanylyltransferase [Anoxybacillus gonensis]MDO0876338.1 bifunctional adenosylcobinamide kinase/adenosylcobinamide-phosphate guanylyltransferase [Anoxybacillus g